MTFKVDSAMNWMATSGQLADATSAPRFNATFSPGA
jgi:hypothetical protein